MRIVSKVSAYKTLGLWNECWKILRKDEDIIQSLDYIGWVNNSKYNERAKLITETVRILKSAEKDKTLKEFFQRLEKELPLELSKIYNKLHVLKISWNNDTHKKKGKIPKGVSRQF